MNTKSRSRQSTVMKAWLMLSVFFILIAGTAASCSPNPEDVMFFSEYFLYGFNEEDDNGETSAVILGYSGDGVFERVTVIPEQIEGAPVTHIGTNNSFKFGFNANLYKKLKSDKVKKLYIPKTIFYFTDYAFDKLTVLEELFYNLTPDAKNEIYLPYFFATLSDEDCKLYVPQISLTHFQKNHNVFIKAGSCQGVELLPANIEFFYNYENASNNNYYWIDNHNDGEAIRQPSEFAMAPEPPKREGYIFDGWYLEPECLNKADLDYDSESRMVYREEIGIISFYAKWIEAEETE